MEVGQPVPESLGRVRVLDARGEERALGSCWAQRDAAIIFVRHFACAGCSEHVAELRPRLDELAELGTDVALVSNGTPQQLATWCAAQQLGDYPIELFTDPTLAAYRAAGLTRSWLGTAGPRAIANLARLFGRGHVNGWAKGDWAQQGGTLYVKRGGELALYHRSARVGDHVPVADLVQTALGARALEASQRGLLA